MSFFDKFISKIGLKRIREELTTPRASDYRAALQFNVRTVGDLPRFSIWTANQMIVDPVVQFGLNIRDALISPSDVEFETANPELGKWLRKQWDVIWGKNWWKITQARQWGYQGMEVLMKEDPTTGFIDVTGLRDFAPFDARALSSGGETVGLKVKGHLRGEDAAGRRRIFMPQALWAPFASRWGNPYGWSIMRGVQSPWWEKWMTGGVKKVTQLRMLKDAYRGLLGRYPFNEKTTDKDGNELSWMEVMRGLMENMNAGSSVVLPSKFDSEGRQLFDIVNQPQAPDPRAIFEWGTRTDKEIWFAMDVPQEIIEAASTGSGFSGRSIPFVVALQLIGGREFGCYLEAIDRMVIRPLAQVNFGVGPASEYKVTPKSLPEIYAEMLGGSAMGGEAVGGQPGAGQQDAAGGAMPEQAGPEQGGGGNGQAGGASGAEGQPAQKQGAGQFIDVKLPSGQVIQRKNPNFGGGQFAENPTEDGGQFAEFDESKISRAAKDTDTGGQFVSKGQQGTPSRQEPGKQRPKKQKAVVGQLADVVATKEGLRLTDGGELPPHLKGKIFKGWTNIKVSLDPKSDVLAKAVDQKGRPQTVYNAEFSARNAALKWDRVRDLQSQFDGMRGENRGNLDGPDGEQAASLRLIMLMGVRPGSDRDTKAAKRAFGATTLQGRHVTLGKGGSVRLQFTGKKGVAIDLEVTDEALAMDLTARKKRSGEGGRLFSTNSNKLRQYSRTLDGGAFSPKDFRTNLGTTAAASIVAQGDAPQTQKEYKQRVREVGDAVAALLGNTRTVALQSYISPTVFSQWRID